MIATRNPLTALDEVIGELDHLHQQAAAGTQKLGVAIQKCKELRPFVVEVANAAYNLKPDISTLVSSNTAIFEAYRDEVKELATELRPSFDSLYQVTSGVDALITATGSTYSFAGVQPNIVFIEPSPLPGEDTGDRYATLLEKLDPALGQTYRAIQEVLFGTRADPERAALYLIRQTFDHFFSHLGPDVDVRNSEFWEEKEGDKPNQVSRRERVLFAISKHVKDPARAKTLGSSANHMIDVYQALNQAHKRGEIDKDKALKSLAEMRGLLNQWIDAIER